MEQGHGVDVATWAEHAIWWSVRGEFMDWCQEQGITTAEDPWAIYARFAHHQRELARLREAAKVVSLNPRRRRKAPWR